MLSISLHSGEFRDLLSTTAFVFLIFKQHFGQFGHLCPERHWCSALALREVPSTVRHGRYYNKTILDNNAYSFPAFRRVQIVVEHGNRPIRPIRPIPLSLRHFGESLSIMFFKIFKQLRHFGESPSITLSIFLAIKTILDPAFAGDNRVQNQ